MLKLYDYYRSSACFRVRIALQLKKLHYEKIPVHLLNNGGEQHSDSYKSVNPQELVPTLQENHDYFTQSLAIIEYLEETYPEPSLFPHDAKERAHARAFALTIAADTHPLNNLRVLNYLKDQLKISDEQKTEWYNHWMHLCFNALEQLIVKYKHRNYKFAFGNEPSIADICLTPLLFSARRFNCDLNGFNELLRIDENCQAHTAFKAAWPDETSMLISNR